jgi:hypothetical protein
MRYLIGGSTVVGFLFLAATAWANPALLPKHEGYPGEKATSPVTGQPLSNDPGQRNQFGETALRQSAGSEDAHITQGFGDQDSRILQSEGAGRLPKVEGPQIKIEPPVKEGTRMPKQ